MRYDFFCRWLQKDGHAPVEYEDAFHLPPYRSVTFPKRFAVVDGATESFESRRFAMMLAKRFATLPLHDGPRDDLISPLWPAVCADWAGFITEESRARGGELSFLDQIGLQKGAAAAFCSLLVWPPHWQRGAIWQADAIGDCCLVHRSGDLLTPFPLSTPDEFSSTPYLVSSNSGLNHTLAERVRVTRGTYRVGDWFYLMSDALACWFLERVQDGGEPWAMLERLGDQRSEKFRDFIRGERGAGRLKNDDVTLVALGITR